MYVYCVHVSLTQYEWSLLMPSNTVRDIPHLRLPPSLKWLADNLHFGTVCTCSWHIAVLVSAGLDRG